MDVNMFLVAPNDSAEPDPGLCCSPLSVSALDEAEAESLAAVLKALADPVRLRLVSIVASSPEGEACTCDLPDAVGKSQPTVSHHLRQLVDAGVLEREQRGKWAWFRLRPETLTALCAVLGDGLVCVPAPGAARPAAGQPAR